MFIGADIDAFASARSLGIRARRAVSFSKNEDSFEDCFKAVRDVAYCIAKSAPDETLSDDAFSDIFKGFGK